MKKKFNLLNCAHIKIKDPLYWYFNRYSGIRYTKSDFGIGYRCYACIIKVYRFCLKPLNSSLKLKKSGSNFRYISVDSRA